MASAFLKSTPLCAAFPVATMIDIGVASPSAHGQAMIRDGHRIHNAVGHPRFRAPDAPDNKRDYGKRDNHRYEITGDNVCEFLNRRAAALRFGNHLDDSGK